MANQDHVDILKSNEAIWEDWRKHNPSVKLDFSSADLKNISFAGRDLTMARFRKAILDWSDFRDCNLAHADFRGSSIRHCRFRHANLDYADLRGVYGYSSDYYDATMIGSKLCDADLQSADFSRAKLTNADLSRANLGLCRLVDTDLAFTKLDDSIVYGVSVWHANLEGASQHNLVISKTDSSEIRIDSIELAQIVHLLLDNNKVRSFIDTISSKLVLILGRFTSERKMILDMLRNEVRNYDKVSVIFDFLKPANRDTDETVSTLGQLAYCVIADLTDPRSIPQELATMIPRMPSVIFKPILQAGYEPWGMYEHFKRYPWVLNIHTYVDKDDLANSLPQIMAEIEVAARERNQK